MNLSDYSSSAKFGMASAIAGAGALAYYWKPIIAFSQEAYQELLKSTWLTRQQAVSSTFIVVILVVLVAAYTGTVDAILSFLMRSLLGSS